MQKMPVTVDELQRAKALLLRQIPLDAMSVDSIAQGLIQRWNLDLLLDEPTIAAEHYLNLNVSDVRAAFVKWLRPDDLVRIDQGPSP
jgi:zinc protease